MQKLAELGKEEKLTGIPGTIIEQQKVAGERDTFGMDDEDWDVYRDIQKDTFSEDDEEDQQTLNELEEKITELDPEFPLLLYKTGPGGHRPATQEDYQIRLWTDRYRGAELIF